ncbi:hypothetical protein H3N56_11245 [Cetobacterium sp. 2A]|uniref:hypothetical protein n=1 Tax=Cetobacterium sp. 2A TaxID=2754723 RepID=UPI00163D2A4D|nr:hypothetical protein [Cetobacterium sp. 2A]MBC2857008.1 hypothetical protein [Cetobacterium sp. 2A]
MKKLLLLALLAVGATSSFAASNQQMVDSTLSATVAGDKVGAGVPFEVRVNIVPKGAELVIVDENDNVYDTMVFDHGTKMAGKLNKSTVEKTAILKRTDNHPFSADLAGTVGTTQYTGQFALESNGNYNPTTNVLTLDKLSSSGDTAGTVMAMPTEFNFIKQERDIRATDNQMRTLVQSTIKAGTTADAGTYIGTGTFTASLIVK